MILQSAFRGWFSKGRRKAEEALDMLRQDRQETERRLENMISQLDGEDHWFMEQHGRSPSSRYACDTSPSDKR